MLSDDAGPGGNRWHVAGDYRHSFCICQYRPKRQHGTARALPYKLGKFCRAWCKLHDLETGSEFIRFHIMLSTRLVGLRGSRSYGYYHGLSDCAYRAEIDAAGTGIRRPWTAFMPASLYGYLSVSSCRKSHHRTFAGWGVDHPSRLDDFPATRRYMPVFPVYSLHLNRRYAGIKTTPSSSTCQKYSIWLCFWHHMFFIGRQKCFARYTS